MSGPRALQAEDIKQLGHFHTNDFPLNVESDEGNVRIVPTWSTRSIILMTTIIAIVFAALAGLIFYKGLFGQSLFFQAVVALAGLLAIIGPIAGSVARKRYLFGRSPLLAYRRIDHVVELHAGARQFERSQVYCILAVATGDGGSHNSELQLITIDNGVFVPHLIITSISSFPRSYFQKVMREFSALTGIPAKLADRSGLFERGELEITSIDGSEA